MDNKMNDLIILDGNNLAYRAYHKFKPMGFTNSKGFPTGAIYGYRLILDSIIKYHKSFNFVVCFDSRGGTFRHDMYKEYKAGRSRNEEISKQFNLIHDITSLRGIPLMRCEGFEADDIIHTLVDKFKGEFDHVYIHSNDKDLHQLVCSNVTQIIALDKPFMTPASVKEKFGVMPRGIKLYLSLVGDTSDNIPGCKGIGKKTAVPIVNKCRNINGLMERSNEIDKKAYLKLQRDFEHVKLSNELITLVNVPEFENCTLVDLKVKEGNKEELNNIYNKLDFKR